MLGLSARALAFGAAAVALGVDERLDREVAPRTRLGEQLVQCPFGTWLGV